MTSTVISLTETQNNYEYRFNCIVCWCPKLMMVYGRCQHKVCSDCLYGEDGVCRRVLVNCPTCQMPDAFPCFRPDIPQDNIEARRCLGVRSCPNKDCKEEMWEWEIEEHLKDCPKRKVTPKKRQRKSSHTPVAVESKITTRSRAVKESNPPAPRRRSLRIILSRVQS